MRPSRLLIALAALLIALPVAHAGFLMIFSSQSRTAGNTTYYVDSSIGNDANSGLSPAAAWASTTPVNAHAYHPGDQVLFNGGQTWGSSNFINLGTTNYGTNPPTAANPLVISTYGTGAATLNLGTTTAHRCIYVLNIAAISVNNITCTGTGAVPQGAVTFENSLGSNQQLTGVTVNNLTVTNFHQDGFWIFGDTGTAGFTNVTVSNSTISGTTGSGFATFGATHSNNHHNVVFTGDLAFNNTGAVDSGGCAGIVLGGVNGGSITNSIAHDNCASNTHGPIGIWTYESTNVAIEFNEAYNNSSANTIDGGGFDLDEQSVNDTMCYNYSHGNKGEGFFLYGGFGTTSGNKICYNISQNDAASRTDVGGITIGMASGATFTTNSIFNNTIYQGTASSGAPFTIGATATANTYTSTTISNNIFLTAGNSVLVNTSGFTPTGLTFLSNNYCPSSAGACTGTFNIKWAGTTYTSLSAWRTATSQEAGATSAQTAYPSLTNAGGGGTTNGYNPGSLSAYTLVGGSPMIGVGQVIASPGSQDYYGHTIPNGTGTGYNIGADGSSPAPAVPQAPQITSPVGGSTVTTAIATINGSGGTNGDTINVTLDSVLDSVNHPVVSGGAWTYNTAALSNANHTVSATETNITGTSVASASVTFTTSAGSAPAAPVILGPTGTVTTTQASINGTGAANTDTINVCVDGTLTGATCSNPTGGGGTSTVNSSLAWVFNTSPLPNSGHSVVASETNSFGTSPSSNIINFTTNVTVAVPNTLDSSKTSSSITLDSPHLTAVVTSTANAFPQSLVTNGYSTGKFHFEMQLNGSGAAATAVGLAQASPAHLLTTQAGFDTTSIAFYGSGALGTFYNSVLQQSGPPTSAGDLIAIEVDIGAGKMWAKDVTTNSNWNNLSTANPGTGTGGVSFTPAGATWYAILAPPNAVVATRSQTMNFGATSFAAACSTNFIPWNGSGTACPTAAAPGTGLTTAVSFLPSDLPVTHWHTPTRPWTALGTTAANYLTRLNTMANWFASQVGGNGCLNANIYPYFSQASGGSGGALPMSIGAQLKGGNTANISAGASSPGVTSMNCDTAAFNVANGQDAGFQMGPLNLAYQLYGTYGGATITTAMKNTWAGKLNTYVGQGTNVNNQTTFGMWGAWLAIQNGFSAYTSSTGTVKGTSGIDCEWTGATCSFNTNTINQSAAFNDSPFGLYQDSTAVSPNSTQVERQSTTLLLMSTEGYNGTQLGAIQTATQKAAQSGMLMQSPDGSNAVGGRVDNHSWVDSGRQLTDDIMAQQLSASNSFLAGQYQRSAYMAFNQQNKYLNAFCCSSATYFQVKNHFNPSLSIGSQFAGGVDYGYNNQQMYFLAGSYLYRSQSVVAEQPAPVEIGGYAFFANGFSQAVLAAGGTSVQLATSGQTSLTTFDSPTLWTALGIERIGRVNWETRIGPSDSGYLGGLGTQTSFGPTWITSGTSWTRLAQNPSTCSGNFTTTFASPVLTFGKVIWTCTGPTVAVTFTQNLTVTPDGVLSQTTCSGCPSTWGMTAPLLTNDGTSGFGNTVTTVSTSGNISSVIWPPTGDSENFLSIPAGGSSTTLVNEGTQDAVSGILQSERMWTGTGSTSDATQTMFIYPKSSSDPSASTVQSGMTVTGTNTYTNSTLQSSVTSSSAHGTVYIGPLAAGGWTNSLVVNGSTEAFNVPCNFIMTLSNGTVTSIEADRNVTVQIPNGANGSHTGVNAINLTAFQRSTGL